MLEISSSARDIKTKFRQSIGIKVATKYVLK